MRHFNKLFLLLLLVGCNEQNANKSTNDSVVHKDADSASIKAQKNYDFGLQQNNDTTLIDLSVNILKLLRNKDYDHFVEFIHPELGIRFSPYAYIDTLHGQILSKKDFITLSKDQKKINWGTFDGSGETINLDIRNYFERFVYDADFLNAEKKSVNKIIGTGNSLNNLKSVYPVYDFTEFYFSGFEPKYEGMDWKSLRLVFKKENSKVYLVAIIHDQWTI